VNYRQFTGNGGYLHGKRTPLIVKKQVDSYNQTCAKVELQIERALIVPVFLQRIQHRDYLLE